VFGFIGAIPLQKNPHLKRITVQFIDIFKKVGLMNQTPTEESTPEKNQNRSVY